MKGSNVISVFAICGALSAVALSAFAWRSMPRQVSVGDHSLRVLVQGEGGPAVIFENYGAAYLEAMSRVQSQVREFTTTVNYDHAGHWGSEPGPKPRDAARVADELRLLLRNAGVPPPYILVGFSFGGPYVRVFADRYPDDVAGLVLVDPTQEAFMAWLRDEWPEVNTLTEAQRASQSEWGSQWESMTMASNAVLPEVPLTLLTGVRYGDSTFGKYVKERWLAAHREWLADYPQAKHVVTARSGHGIPNSEPELVIGAIREVYQAAVDQASVK